MDIGRESEFPRTEKMGIVRGNSDYRLGPIPTF